MGSRIKARLAPEWSLLYELTRREIETRYRGGLLGLLWMVVGPFLLLSIYAFVYLFVFGMRVEQSDRLGYVIWLYAGLGLYLFFAEIVTRAPSSIRSHPNFVKKVIFPLEVLVASKFASAAVSFLVTFLLLILFVWFHQATLHVSVAWLPVVLLPTILFSYGLGLALASLGVFIRDADEMVRYVIRIVFYLTPIVYPPALIPSQVGGLIWLNPLTSMVDSYRRVVVMGLPPLWGNYVVFLVVAVATLYAGRKFYQKLRPMFADVL